MYIILKKLAEQTCSGIPGGFVMKGAKLFKGSVLLSYGEKFLGLQLADFHKEFVDLQLADYTVKKVREFPVSSRDVTNQTPPGQE